MAIAIASVPQRAVRLGLTCVAGALLALAVYEGTSTWERGDERMAARASIARRAAACIAAPRMAPDGCYKAVCWNAAYARKALQLGLRTGAVAGRSSAGPPAPRAHWTTAPPCRVDLGSAKTNNPLLGSDLHASAGARASALWIGHPLLDSASECPSWRDVYSISCQRRASVKSAAVHRAVAGSAPARRQLDASARSKGLLGS